MSITFARFLARANAGERIEVNVHRDFKPGAGSRLQTELALAGAVHGDTFLFESDAPLRLFRHGALPEWLRENGLGRLARPLERMVVPCGYIAGLVLGEGGARIRVFTLPEPIAPRCAALR